MRIPLVLGAGLVAALVAVGLVLSDSAQRQAGSNYVPERERARTIEGAGGYCQRDQDIPADTAALRLLLGTFEGPRPAVDVVVRAAGRRLTSGRIPADPVPPTEHQVVPLEPVARSTPNAIVCLRVRAGKGRRTVLYGTLGQVRFEWLRAGQESWIELLPTIVHRFALGKANPVGAWLLAVALVLLALATGAALRVAAREL